MINNLAFLIYYHKSNKYSFNALIGALETNVIFNEIDLFFVKNKEELIDRAEEFNKKYDRIVIGISLFTTQIWEARDLIKILKGKYQKNTLYIAGGPHPTGDPIGTLKMGIDVVVIREGEDTLIELITKIKNNEDFLEVKGIGYNDEQDDYVFTGKRDLIDLNEYPPFPIESSKYGAIEITRGCPYVCYFCQTPYIAGTIPRHRTIESICKYVKIMKEKNLTDIRFITPNAFSYGSSDGKHLSLTKLEDLLIKIKDIIGDEGRIFLGSFPSEVRPEHVNIDTLALIKKYASNDNIIIGAQSGSQKILDLCHRGHTIEDVYNAVELTIDAGLKANVDFIFGLPGEDEEDITQTIEMMEKLAKLGARIHTHSFIPLPQTPFAEKSVSRINNSIQNVVKTLTSKGFAFGDWKKQERLAIKIAKYLRTKKI